MLPGPERRTLGLARLLSKLALLPLCLQPSRAFDDRGEPPGDLLEALLAAAVPSICPPADCWTGLTPTPASWVNAEPWLRLTADTAGRTAFRAGEPPVRLNPVGECSEEEAAAFPPVRSTLSGGSVVA